MEYIVLIFNKKKLKLILQRFVVYNYLINIIVYFFVDIIYIDIYV